jgi:hypothetical protein
MENTYSMDGQMIEDFERISQIESLILQADQWEEEQKIMQERLPAIIFVHIEKNNNDTVESKPLAF